MYTQKSILTICFPLPFSIMQFEPLISMTSKGPGSNLVRLLFVTTTKSPVLIATDNEFLDRMHLCSTQTYQFSKKLG